MLPKIRFALIACGGWALIAVLCLHRFVALLGVRAQADPLMHYSGGVAITYVAYRTIREARTLFGSLSPGVHALIAFSFGCTAAVGWEIMEFASDKLLGTHVQKSLEETMLDLVFGTFGAACVVGLLAFLDRKSR